MVGYGGCVLSINPMFGGGDGLMRFQSLGPDYARVSAAAAASSDSQSGMVERVWSMLFALAFEGLVIYSLVASNTNEVSQKCGDSLWKFMLARLILFFFEGFLFVFLGALGMCVSGVCACWTEGVKVCLMLIFPLVCLVALHATLVGVGFSITQKAMADSLCASALSSASSTDSPLLALLAYVYVALDCLVLFLVTCGGLYVGCFSVAMARGNNVWE